ncbi:MAG: Crp/Fnr family transcriptional regulator [Flavobacteriales bacterium]|nr:Crp/Fnr family transcriptional regulator [Flavobacteriales bacterium]
MTDPCNPLCDNCAIDASAEVNIEGDAEMGMQSNGRRKMVYVKGESVFTEGSQPSGVFCLKKGKVKIHKTGSHKKEQILRFAREGQLLGTRALIRNEYYTSSATTIEGSVLCFIPKHEFLAKLGKDDDLKAFVLSNLSNNLKLAEDKITQLSISSVGQRLAIIILRLIEVYGFEEDGRTVAIELTREEMANLVGAANETTIRLLSSFKRKGLILLNGRKLTVINAADLAKLAIATS